MGAVVEERGGGRGRGLRGSRVTALDFILWLWYGVLSDFLATVRFTVQIPIMSGSAGLWGYYEYINGRKRFLGSTVWPVSIQNKTMNGY